MVYSLGNISGAHLSLGWVSWVRRLYPVSSRSNVSLRITPKNGKSDMFREGVEGITSQVLAMQLDIKTGFEQTLTLTLIVCVRSTNTYKYLQIM